MDIITKIIALILPWKNETKAQKVGTVITIIVLLGSFVLQFLPPVPPSPVPPVPTPDVIQDNAPVVPQDAPGSLPDVDAPKDTAPGSTGFLVGCSAAQQAIMRASSVDLLRCLTDVGADAAKVAIAGYGAGYKIDGEAIGYDVLKGAMPCLLQLGFVAVETYAKSPNGFFGSANEKNVYAGDRIVIKVSPKRFP